MPDYTPENPRFYSKYTGEFKQLNMIMSNYIDITDEEKVHAYANEKNLAGYLHSRLPFKAANAEKREEFLEMFPNLKVDPAQHAARRQLSEQARCVISDVAARKYFASGEYSRA